MSRTLILSLLAAVAVGYVLGYQRAAVSSSSAASAGPATGGGGGVEWMTWQGNP